MAEEARPGEAVLRGRAFEPGRARPIPASLRVDAAEARVVADADGRVLAAVPRRALAFEAPIGRAPRRVRLADGTLFETEDHAGAAALDDGRAGALLHRMEAFHPRLVLVVLACVAAGWLAWRFGLDLLVAAAVALTPPALTAAIDRGTLQAADLTLAGPSRLAAAEHAEVEAAFQALLAALPAEERAARDFTLEFRHVPAIGPNALALPGGTVVVTDALVRDFPDPDVLAGVLGHEIGHVVGEHGLRQVYRSLGAFALVSLMAGDIGPVVQDALLEGGVFLSLAYTRTNEARADAFAVDLTTAAGFDPAGLIAFFEAMQAEGAGESASWFSTHPGTEERIDAIRAAIRAR